MIKRIYRTEEECAELWKSECFSPVEAEWFTNQPDFFETFEFFGEDGETEEYGYIDMPMWSTWWRVCDRFDEVWISEHQEETVAAGFTLIFRNGELFALGIDGAGYGFLEAHWVPLYRSRGLKWHDENTKETED